MFDALPPQSMVGGTISELLLRFAVAKRYPLDFGPNSLEYSRPATTYAEHGFPVVIGHLDNLSPLLGSTWLGLNSIKPVAKGPSTANTTNPGMYFWQNMLDAGNKVRG